MAKKDVTSNVNAEFVLSNNQMSGFYHVINQIKNDMKEKNQQIILVIPDKFSLNAEQIFMERTSLSSVFNVWITTLSRLVAQVVGEENGLPLLTKNSGIMLVSKIISENLDKLCTYKKLSADYTLAETMYNAINLLKSSGVLPNDLKNNFGDDTFGQKMKDLYVVYNEYEKHMKSNLDTITRLQIFDKKIKNDEYIKPSKIYFAMFDSFTNVQIGSLCNLAKTCKKLSIALCTNTHQSNSYIYDNSLFYKIKDYFDDSHVQYNITNVKEKKNNLQDFLSKNLFAYKIDNTFETDKINLTECDGVEDEARYVAGRIKYLVMERGYSFDDINVAVNGLGDYADTIAKIFDEYDLPYYLDSEKTMLDHYFVKTFFKISKYVSGDNSLSNALSIVKSSIFDIEYQKKCDFDNYCKKYGKFGDELFDKFQYDGTEMEKNAEFVRTKIFDEIKNLQNSLNNSNDVFDLCTICKNYFSKIIENNNLFNNAGDIFENRVDAQAYQKFMNVFDEAENMLGGVAMSHKMFFDMLENALGAINLLTVPLKCNAVFVGDASISTYQAKKIMFVMGSTLSRMPAYKTTAGAITDEDIDNFVAKKRISPSILELNKREKFKLFNLLLLPSDVLELTYSSIIGGEVQQKSEFVNALQKIITKNGVTLGIQKNVLQELEIFNSSSPKFPAYLVGSIQNAMLIGNSRDSKLKYLLKNNFDYVLKSQKEIYAETEQRFDIDDATKYLFPKRKTSISQVEKYFKCPFLQFVTHAIKPQEQEKFELKANIVGSILHKVAEIFVRQCISNGYKIDNVEQDAKSIYKKVLDSDDFKDFKSNKYFLAILEYEVVRFCKALKHQIDSSDFKPKYTEFKFENYVLKNGIGFSGFIDRVDICESLNALSVIDYKSGSDKFSFKDIYYGLKLQLIAYLKVISEKLGLSMAGAMYMPIKNKFNDLDSEEFASYKLDGVFSENIGTLKHMDKNLIENSTSNILPVALTKTGEIHKRCSEHTLSFDEFNKVSQYTFEVLSNAVNEMLSGYIMPKPYVAEKNPCDYCQFKALCHYEYSKKGFREFERKNKTSFKKG